MARSLTFDLGGPVHVVDHGGSGRPILLVHGLGGSHVNWTAVADPLTAHGSVRAIDLIGFGRTPPAGRSSAVSAQRDLVIDYLRRHAAAPAVLVGNSMGGLVSIMVARSAPDLVESLVLVDPALPVVRPHVDVDVMRRLALPLVPGLGPRSFRAGSAHAVDDPEGFVDQMLDVLCADASQVSRSMRAEMIDMASARAAMPWAADAFVEAARSIFAIVVRGRTFARRIRTITAPTLIVHGEEDRLVDVASARWLVRRRPTWQLEVFDEVGHVPQIEAPERFLDAVGGWLAGPANARAG